MTIDLKSLSLGELIRGMTEIVARKMPNIIYWEDEFNEHGRGIDKDCLENAKIEYSLAIIPYVRELDRREELYLPHDDPAHS